jgi:methyl-accepting chemotaxis protein
MIEYFKNLKISKKLYVFAFGAILSLIFFGLFSHRTINEVKVNGELYQKIVNGKDLVADILPPPEYIIESYLICNQLFLERDIQKIDELVKQGAQLKSDFSSRHEYWTPILENPEAKNLLLVEAYTPAMEFYKIRDEEYIPAIRTGNYALAENILTQKLKIKYETHRKAIDQLVSIVNKDNARLEDNSKRSISDNMSLMYAIFAISIILIFLMATLISKSIVPSIRQAVLAANAIAKGELSFFKQNQ